MSRHPVITPGPWFTSEPNEGGGILIKPIPGQVVAQCDELPEMQANARLIAAAPELLEAALLVLAWHEAEKDHTQEPSFYKRMQMCLASEDAIRAAIAKATGGMGHIATSAGDESVAAEQVEGK